MSEQTEALERLLDEHADAAGDLRDLSRYIGGVPIGQHRAAVVRLEEAADAIRRVASERSVLMDPPNPALYVPAERPADALDELQRFLSEDDLGYNVENWITKQRRSALQGAAAATKMTPAEELIQDYREAAGLPKAPNGGGSLLDWIKEKARTPVDGAEALEAIAKRIYNAVIASGSLYSEETLEAVRLALAGAAAPGEPDYDALADLIVTATEHENDPRLAIAAILRNTAVAAPAPALAGAIDVLIKLAAHRILPDDIKGAISDVADLRGSR